MWFFASLRNGSITVHHQDGKEEKWDETAVVTFDTTNILEVSSQALRWKPKRWNKGEFDMRFMWIRAVT